MIVAGIGCRRGCAADDIVGLVRSLGGADALAAPEWKQDELGLLQASRELGLPLRFVARAALEAVQALCPTGSTAAMAAVGLRSVAEAAAIAGGGALLRPRVSLGGATCALVRVAPACGPLTQPSPRGRGHFADCSLPLLLPLPLPLGEGRGEGPTPRCKPP